MSPIRTVFVNAILLFTMQTAAHCQPPTAANPQLNAGLFDIGGVKLGMSVDAATTALQAFDASFVIAKLFATEPERGFASLGSAEATGKPTSYLTSMSAKDEGTILISMMERSLLIITSSAVRYA